MPKKRLSVRHKKFADNYLKSGNKEQSALNAGYSETYARSQSYKLLENVGIKAYLTKRMKELESEKIADVSEILQYLTSVQRGEIEEEEVVIENIGDYKSKARKIKKQVSVRDRTKAAELLSKRYPEFSEKIEMDVKSNKLDAILEQLKE